MFGKDKGPSDGMNSGGVGCPNSPSLCPGLLLEESPKWHLLSMVLEEVRREVRTATTHEREGEGEGERRREAGRVLVVVNDERTCYQLKQVNTSLYIIHFVCVVSVSVCGWAWSAGAAVPTLPVSEVPTVSSERGRGRGGWGRGGWG